MQVKTIWCFWGAWFFGFWESNETGVSAKFEQLLKEREDITLLLPHPERVWIVSKKSRWGCQRRLGEINWLVGRELEGLGAWT